MHIQPQTQCAHLPALLRLPRLGGLCMWQHCGAITARSTRRNPRAEPCVFLPWAKRTWQASPLPRILTTPRFSRRSALPSQPALPLTRLPALLAASRPLGTAHLPLPLWMAAAPPVTSGSLTWQSTSSELFPVGGGGGHDWVPPALFQSRNSPRQLSAR